MSAISVTLQEISEKTKNLHRKTNNKQEKPKTTSFFFMFFSQDYYKQLKQTENEEKEVPNKKIK
jgi:hypothetical protein